MPEHARALLQGQRDQVAETAARQRVLVREEPVVGTQPDLRAVFHGFGRHMRTVLACEGGGCGLVENEPDVAALAGARMFESVRQGEAAACFDGRECILQHQTRAVTVYNLVTSDSIEQGMLGTLADKRSLADGVLDRLGNLQEIKLRSGRQAQVARLEQVMLAGVTAKTPPKPMLPADPALAFAERALAEVNGNLVTCEERYPADAGGAMVVVAIVERDAAQWRLRLEAAHAETWKHAPSPADVPRLLVLDRATQAALDDLAAAGLITKTTVAVRALHPPLEASAPPLTPDERERADFHRGIARRKVNAAQALLSAGLTGEAALSASEALHALTRARAIEQGLPPPPDLESCLRPPWRMHWPAESVAGLTALTASPPTMSDGTLEVIGGFIVAR